MADPLFLLDSNIYILALGAAIPALRRQIEACRRGTLVTSTVVVAEVLRGISRDDARTLDRLDALLALAPPVPFDTAAARCYATLPFKRAGFDRLIAAHALSLRLVMVTANPGDFADVPNLRVEDWTR